jgi:phosphoesterase RecJ-like protein
MNPKLRDKIRETIRPARRILLVTHVAPDGDAIGSLLGLSSLLEAQGKELTPACEDPVPSLQAFLPGSERVTQHAEGPFDLVISLDCSDRRRMGNIYRDEFAALPLLNIDHHVTNTEFGTVNWVDPGSVSTSQMVLTLAEALGWEITAPVATCLLTGLVTDTRGFRTHNVDQAAVGAALRLMEAGASLIAITSQTLARRPLASIRLWGQAFDRIQLDDGILWTEVTRAMREQWSLPEYLNWSLANFLSEVEEAQVIIVFAERDNGSIDVSMRAIPGYDVAQVALSLGGGGHPQAAGCTLEGDLAEIKEKVLAAVRRSLAEQQTNHS